MGAAGGLGAAGRAAGGVGGAACGPAAGVLGVWATAADPVGAATLVASPAWILGAGFSGVVSSAIFMSFLPSLSSRVLADF